MQILVERQAGLTLALDVSLGDTIKAVKKKIQEKEGIPFDQQQLNFDRNQLNDECTLSEYNIQDKSVICLIHTGYVVNDVNFCYMYVSICM